MTQPVITIYNKPETENSVQVNEDKNVMSEGRGLIGKKFAFENGDGGNISRIPEVAVFQSLTAGQMQKAKQEMELTDRAQLELQRRKLSNQLEYNNRIEKITEGNEEGQPTDPRNLFDKKHNAALICVRGESQDCLKNNGPPEFDLQDHETVQLKYVGA